MSPQKRDIHWVNMKYKYWIGCLFIIFLVLSTRGNTSFPTDTVILKHFEKENLKEKIYNAPLVLKTSPTAFMMGGVFPFTSEYRLEAEITTARKQSDQVAFSILGKNIFLKSLEKASGQSSDRIYKVTGWRVQYAHKFYLVNRKHHSPFGFYVAPLLSYANAHVALGLKRYYRKTYFDFRNFNANIILGAQAGSIDHLTIDFYFGAGYKSNKAYFHYMNNRVIPYDSSKLWDSYSWHFNAVFGIDIGYSF